MTFRQLVVVLAVVVLPTAFATAAPAPAQGDEPAQSTAAAHEASYGRGFALFQRYCRSCHGKEAMGDGHVAAYLKVPPTNLTRLAADNGGEFPTERVLRSIDGREESLPIHGRDMPIWGAVFLVDEGQTEADVDAKLADLVAYLRGIQVEAGSSAPERPED
jgi:cytochrome c1